MHIVVVGGLERHESEIERRAGERGHTIEFHRGRVGGRRADELESMIQRSDLAIIVTRVNSHGAMYIAKKAALRNSCPTLALRTCSPSSFSAQIDSWHSQAMSLATGTGGRAVRPATLVRPHLDVRRAPTVPDRDRGCSASRS
jgi:hypothetical protein